MKVQSYLLNPLVIPLNAEVWAFYRNFGLPLVFGTIHKRM